MAEVNQSGAAPGVSGPGVATPPATVQADAVAKKAEEDRKAAQAKKDAEPRKKARSIHSITHDGVDIPHNKVFSGPESDVQSLIASGAAEPWPPIVDPNERSAAIVAARKHAAQVAGKESSLKLEEDEPQPVKRPTVSPVVK